MAEANNTLLMICAEFETIASNAPRHGHIKLIMRNLFDLVGIQKLYNGGGITEEGAISMIERQCKYAREELKRSGIIKDKKKPKSVIAPIPQEYDGHTHKGNPIGGDIAKLNQYSNDFVKTAIPNEIKKDDPYWAFDEEDQLLDEYYEGLAKRHKDSGDDKVEEHHLNKKKQLALKNEK